MNPILWLLIARRQMGDATITEYALSAPEELAIVFAMLVTLVAGLIWAAIKTKNLYK